MSQTWELSAIDTLFFRESRPMEAPGSSELNSVFPPPARTLAGAIRSHIGETQGVDWQAFNKDESHELRSIIGYGDDLADIQLKGTWVHYKGQRLYPAPLTLLGFSDDKQDLDKITETQVLEIGKPYECDLGKNVRLAQLPINSSNQKNSESTSRPSPLQNYWLTADGFTRLLAGNVTTILDSLVQQNELFDNEHRLGIARDNQIRSVKEGMLYQTRHIRLKQEVALSVDVSGVGDYLQAGMVKLGGEGRMAALSATKINHHFPDKPSAESAHADALKGIIIYLLTPMLIADDNSDFLPGFKQSEAEPITHWQGELQGIRLKLISSVIGKVHREGGWDVAKHKPRTVKSLLPAGSAFYCETEDIQKAIDALHNTQIGEEQHLGRGHIAVGLWLDANAHITEGQRS